MGGRVGRGCKRSLGFEGRGFERGRAARGGEVAHLDAECLVTNEW